MSDLPQSGSSYWLLLWRTQPDGCVDDSSCFNLELVAVEVDWSCRRVFELDPLVLLGESVAKIVSCSSSSTRGLNDVDLNPELRNASTASHQQKSESSSVDMKLLWGQIYQWRAERQYMQRELMERNSVRPAEFNHERTPLGCLTLKLFSDLFFSKRVALPPSQIDDALLSDNTGEKTHAALISLFQQSSPTSTEIFFKNLNVLEMSQRCSGVGRPLCSSAFFESMLLKREEIDAETNDGVSTSLSAEQNTSPTSKKIHWDGKLVQVLNLKHLIRQRSAVTLKHLLLEANRCKTRAQSFLVLRPPNNEDEGQLYSPRIALGLYLHLVHILQAVQMEWLALRRCSDIFSCEDCSLIDSLLRDVQVLYITSASNAGLCVLKVCELEKQKGPKLQRAENSLVGQEACDEEEERRGMHEVTGGGRRTVEAFRNVKISTDVLEVLRRCLSGSALDVMREILLPYLTKAIPVCREVKDKCLQSMRSTTEGEDSIKIKTESARVLRTLSLKLQYRVAKMHDLLLFPQEAQTLLHKLLEEFRTENIISSLLGPPPEDIAREAQKLLQEITQAESVQNSKMKASMKKAFESKNA